MGSGDGYDWSSTTTSFTYKENCTWIWEWQWLQRWQQYNTMCTKKKMEYECQYKWYDEHNQNEWMHNGCSYRW